MKIISSVFVICIFSVIHIECILQGEKTDIQSHPYVVSIRDSKAKVHIAGGTIISSRLILTSARAIEDKTDPKTINVLAGTTDVTQDGTTLTIEKIVKHKDDIALLRTDKDIIFSVNIQPIEVASNGHKLVKSVVSGWGKIKNEDRLDYTSQLTTQTYPILDDYNCKLRLKEIDQSSQFVPKVGAVDEKTPGKTLCTLQTLPNTGICTGDLGSPLTQGNQIVGIASWYHVDGGDNNTTSKCSGRYPNVYTKVESYADWIATADGNMIRATSFVLIAFGVTLISIF